ncbi:hypothetical protein V9K67_26555 [Paraflavisolibacter sp. H34]|uniref:hypothetical protein n=1 Tax=Huijunlia imazamoxiresistens TaxID=3127457 RepID=UPI0030195713
MSIDQKLIEEKVKEYRLRVDRYIQELDELTKQIEQEAAAGEMTLEVRDLLREFHRKKIAMMEETLQHYEEIKALVPGELDNPDVARQEADMRAAIEEEKEELAKYQ